MSGKTKIHDNKRWVGFVFAGGMFLAGGMCSWLGVASARTQGVWWAPLLIGLAALAAAGGATCVMVNEWRHEQPLAASAGQSYRMRPDASASMKFLAWLAIALVWNGFITFAVALLMLKEPGSLGRLVGLGFFWLAFAAPGVWMIRQTIAQARVLFGGDRTQATLSSATLRPGEQATVSIRHRSRVGVETIAVNLLNQEHKRRKQRLVSRTLYERVLGERRNLAAGECQPWEHSFALQIPASGQPSGRERNYAPLLSWDIVVRVQPTGRPAYELKFPLRVAR